MSSSSSTPSTPSTPSPADAAGAPSEGGAPPCPEPELWLRPEVAAEYLGVGTGALQKLKREGLPYHQMTATYNGLCLFLASELDEWRKNHPRLPVSPPKHVRRPRYRPRGASLA